MILAEGFNLTTLLPFAMFGVFAATAWLLMELLSAKKPRAEQRIVQFRRALQCCSSEKTEASPVRHFESHFRYRLGLGPLHILQEEAMRCKVQGAWLTEAFYKIFCSSIVKESFHTNVFRKPIY